MKRTPYIPQWAAVVLIAVLSLSACERPIPREDVTEEPDITSEAPVVIPTTPPVNLTVQPYPAPTEGQPAATQSGEQPAGEATPAAETPTEVPTEVPPTSPPPATETTHVVQRGETLFQIAQRYNVSVQDIATANNLTNINRLDVGQRLIIPAPGTGSAPPPQQGERTHVVQRGENLFRIGLQYGFTVEQLASYNNIANPHQIEVGQVIRIPPGP